MLLGDVAGKRCGDIKFCERFAKDLRKSKFDFHKDGAGKWIGKLNHRPMTRTIQTIRRNPLVTSVAVLFVSLLVALTGAHFSLQAQASGLVLPEPVGVAVGTNTQFVIDDSAYHNITVTSTEIVSLRVTSSPSLITLRVHDDAATGSAAFTISGLPANETFYLYEDDLSSGTPVTTDAAGAFTYTQDLTRDHLVYIQEQPSTYTITAPGGGDCDDIGVWDESTTTCTMTMNVTETVVVQSGATLNGADLYTVSGTGVGVQIGEDATVENLTITNVIWGVATYFGDFDAGSGFTPQRNATIRNNTISNATEWGIVANSNGHRIEGNTITNSGTDSNRAAIGLEQANEPGGDTIVIGNTIQSNTYGILAYNDFPVDPGTSNFQILGNTFSNILGVVSYISDIPVSGNSFTDQSAGVVIGSERMTVTRNVFADSLYGLYLVEGEDIISHNPALAKRAQVYNNNFVQLTTPVGSDSTNTVVHNHQFSLPFPVGGNHWEHLVLDGDCTNFETPLRCDSGQQFDLGDLEPTTNLNGVVDQLPWYAYDGWEDAGVSSPPIVANEGQVRHSDGVALPEGATISEDTIRIVARASDAEADNVQLEVEVKPVGTAFDGTGLTVSGFVTSSVADSGPITIFVSGLVNGSYHWRVRAQDITGSYSPWWRFGDPDINVADFTVSGLAPPPPPTITDPDGPNFIQLPFTARGGCATTVDVRVLDASQTEVQNHQNVPCASGTWEVVLDNLSPNIPYTLQVCNDGTSDCVQQSFDVEEEVAPPPTIINPSNSGPFTELPITANGACSTAVTVVWIDSGSVHHELTNDPCSSDTWTASANSLSDGDYTLQVCNDGTADCVTQSITLQTSQEIKVAVILAEAYSDNPPLHETGNQGTIEHCAASGSQTYLNGRTKEYYFDILTCLNDYLDEVSYGSVQLSFDINSVLDNGGDWYRLPQSYQNWASYEAAGSIEGALLYTYNVVNEAGFNLEGQQAFVDADVVFVVGGGATSISITNRTFWPSDQPITDKQTIFVRESALEGVWAHELIHVLGEIVLPPGQRTMVPDLGEGVAGWGIMGGESIANIFGQNPMHPTSYVKNYLGWLDYSGGIKPSSFTGTVSPEILADQNLGDMVYRYNLEDDFEDDIDDVDASYYIIERRKNTGTWDASTPFDDAHVLYRVDPNGFSRYGYFTDGQGNKLTPYSHCRSINNPTSVYNNGALENGDVYKDWVELVQFRAVANGVEIEPLDSFGNSYSQVAVKQRFEGNDPACKYVDPAFPFDPSLTDDLDLHAYDGQGNHVGVNYETGEYEIGIAGAIASGDLVRSVEWIMVPDSVTDVRYLVKRPDVDNFYAAYPEIAQAVETTDSKYDVFARHFDGSTDSVTTTPIQVGEIISSNEDIVYELDGTTGITLSDGAVDDQGPTISHTSLNATYPYNSSSVEFDYSADDALSGVASVSATLNGNPLVSGTTLTFDVLGDYQIVITAADNAGNETIEVINYSVVDVVPPTITHTALNASYLLNSASVTFSYSATDDISGVVTLTTTLDGQPLNSGDTLTFDVVGAHQIVITATDGSGNQSVETIDFSVVYDFVGFQNPVKNDGSGIYKQGRTLPVKFELFDVNGVVIDDASATISMAFIQSGISGSEEVPLSTGNNDTGNLFRWDEQGQQYIYNLDTSGMAIGTWEVYADLDDGTRYTVEISIRE